MLPNLPTYDFICPNKIVFGWGRRDEVGELAARLGSRAFVISGSRTLDANGTLDELEQCLQRHDVEVVRLATISHEPEVTDVDRATRKLKQQSLRQGDFVIGIGGGSALDLAKAISAMATNQHGESVSDFLEGVGRGLSISEPPLPMLAMPTTAGTGTEATKNAVISSYDPKFKKSLRSELMVPKLVLIDPQLSTSVPADITASTGMDTITQLIESFISRRAKPIPQALCLQGLQLAVPQIEEAVTVPNSQEARSSMAHAALLSGIALANSGLGMAHGVAAALGVHARVPHGLACAVLLPVAMRVNRDVQRRDLARLGRLMAEPEAVVATENPAVPEGTEQRDADIAIDFIDDLCSRIGIPRRLSEIGVSRDQLPAIVKSSRGNSMNGNPRELTDDELGTILGEMF